MLLTVAKPGFRIHYTLLPTGVSGDGVCDVPHKRALTEGM
jgi:hypothetical protein